MLNTIEILTGLGAGFNAGNAVVLSKLRQHGRFAVDHFVVGGVLAICALVLRAVKTRRASRYIYSLSNWLTQGAMSSRGKTLLQ